MKDARTAWREHCVAGGGAGSGQPAASSERDRRARVSGHKAVLSLEPPAPGVLQSGCRCGLCGSIDNIPLCLEAGSILHDSSERSEVDLARAVWLPPCHGQLSCAGLLALQQAGAPALLPGAGPARRSVSSPFGSMDGRRSCRVAAAAFSHFWPGVCSAGPWLEGQQGKP